MLWCGEALATVSQLLACSATCYSTVLLVRPIEGHVVMYEMLGEAKASLSCSETARTWCWMLID